MGIQTTVSKVATVYRKAISACQEDLHIHIALTTSMHSSVANLRRDLEAEDNDRYVFCDVMFGGRIENTTMLVVEGYTSHLRTLSLSEHSTPQPSYRGDMIFKCRTRCVAFERICPTGWSYRWEKGGRALFGSVQSNYFFTPLTIL